MAKYVDGFVIPIKRSKLKEYHKMAKWGYRVWMKYGALHYYETYVDEFTPYGAGFKKMCKLKSGETAILAFIVFKSKAHRDKVNKKVHAEMAKSKVQPKMPFDFRRFAMGGCKVLVSSK